MKEELLNFIYSVGFYLFRIFPIKKNKIVFSNFAGKGMGDNPKYLYLALKDKMPDMDAVWLIEKDESRKAMPKGVRAVQNRSLQKIYELATAKIWIDNCRKSRYVKKRKNQYYVMTWHGGLGLKRVEKDVIDRLGKKYYHYAVHDSRQIDLMLSNSKWCTDLYQRAFWYQGDILEKGLPRNDIFFKKQCEVSEKIRKKYSIDSSSRLVIYAPTFREDHSMESFNIDFSGLLAALQEKYKAPWKILLRFHPSMSERMVIEKELREQIVDVSDYDDIYEILSVSDLLITDYSGIMFDFASTRRPAFIYAADEKDYVEERGFYWKLDMLPFPVAYSNQELMENIRLLEEEKYVRNLEDFFSLNQVCDDGNASAFVAEYILKKAGCI